MSKYAIYDYIHPSQGNLMKMWSVGLQKKERAKLNAKIDALQMHGTDLIPGILAPTRCRSIFKLKVQGQVKLRPMLCEGPGEGRSFTFLLGAKEISWEYQPINADENAADLRKDLIANPKRRIPHERIA